MSEPKIIEQYKHEMEIQGCHLKETKKMIILDNDYSITVHFRSIEDDLNRIVRSFKAREHLLNGCSTRTEETKVILNRTVSFEDTEMTSGEIMEFEEDWKKLWHQMAYLHSFAGARRKHRL